MNSRPLDVESQTVQTPFRESGARFRTLFRMVFVSAAIGLAAAFHIPIQLLLMISAGFIIIRLVFKFFKDNRRLAREVGSRRLLKAMFVSAIVFAPFILILFPGFWLGSQINHWTNRGIDMVTVMSAPQIISEQVQKRIERQVEERIRRNLPWWYQPAIWVGAADDYATQVKTEIEIVMETVDRAQAKPFIIRAGSGVLKAGLLAIGIYSFAWVTILFMRTYGALFGRVLVASKPPVILGSVDPEKKKKRRRRRSRPVSGPLIESGSQINITLEKGEQLFVRRADLPGNAPPDWSLRWRGGSLLMRLRKGLFSMDRVEGSSDARSLPFRGQGGSQYVSIILSDEQEVIVNPDRLSGFSDSVRFYCHWDFNMAMLALQHPVSLIANGPGRLILKSPGAPTSHQNALGAAAVSLKDLMLFGRDARFEIEASKGLHNYFASGCLVKPISGQLFVTMPGQPGKVSFFRNFWRLIKQVYLPI